MQKKPAPFRAEPTFLFMEMCCFYAFLCCAAFLQCAASCCAKIAFAVFEGCRAFVVRKALRCFAQLKIGVLVRVPLDGDRLCFCGFSVG